MTDFRLRGGARPQGSARDGRRGRRSAIAGRVERDPGPARMRGAGLVRIVVAHEQPLLDVAAIAALNADAGFEVVGEAAFGSDLLSITELMEPDVVLLVSQSPRHDGLDCLPRLRRCCPDVEVIVCSPAAGRDHIDLAFQLGACGFVMTADPGNLAAAVRRVVEGTAYHPSRAPARLANGPRAFHPRG